MFLFARIVKDSLNNNINLNVFFSVAIPSVYKDWDEDDITGKVIQ
jgi:hypothetical protein